MRKTSKAALSASAPVLIVMAALSACGGDSGSQPDAVREQTLATASDIRVTALQGGPTPFIAFVNLEGVSVSKVATVSYTIEPKVGTASKVVSVKYTIDALRNRGRASGSVITLPVYGLYANTSNVAHISIGLADGSSQGVDATIVTPTYTATNALSRPTFTLARASGSNLGFDFLLVKTSDGGPATILDSDGNIRWAAPEITKSPVLFRDNGFYAGAYTSPTMSRIELDGTTSQIRLDDKSVAGFHHDLSYGKRGIFAELNLTGRQEDYLAEITPTGSTLKSWDMVTIIGNYMRSQGDDPSTFVRPGVDWFHMNSAIYDEKDDSVVISSRENFIMKLDYTTGDIKWIFGDKTKFWYQFPSLRAKALNFTGEGLVPIGQHALSLLDDGQLMVFNNGFGSVNQPVGAPAGVTRTFSAVTAFNIDGANMTASAGYTFDDNKSVYSPVCSSAYFADDRSLFVTYSSADNYATLRFKGLNSSGQLVFDMSFPTGSCTSGWNAQTFPFSNIAFDK